MTIPVVAPRFVGVLALAAGLLPSEAAASPTRQWLDGVIAYTEHARCLSDPPATESLTGNYVGYFGNTDVTFPRVGDIYYAHAVVTTVASAVCEGPYINLEVALPPSTHFAISAGNPVNCFFTPPGGTPALLTDGSCPQTPDASSLNPGNWTLNPASGENPAWPLAPGATIEIQFPLRSVEPLSGQPLSAFAQALDGDSNPFASPSQGVFVGAKPPGSRLGQGGADWDGDLKSDIAVYHPPSGLWYIRQSATGTTLTVGYGGTGYAPVPADYDVDGNADIAVYHSSSGLWFVRPSSWNPSGTSTVAFGGSGYKPVPSDYDLDGRADFAVYHRPSGLWYVRLSTRLATASEGLGDPASDPVPKDYDGDGLTDVAVYNPASGQWLIHRSSNDAFTDVVFGGSGYVAVPRDYDGDGKADIAVYHQASGLWFIGQSSTGTEITVGYGSAAYTPVPADYDGDGKADIAVYHEPSGLWFIRQSTTLTTLTIGYGGTGFPPVNN